MNMVLYLNRRKIPDEVLIIHRIRISFVEFRTGMDMLMTVSEFARGFGASDRGISELTSGL